MSSQEAEAGEQIKKDAVGGKSKSIEDSNATGEDGFGQMINPQAR